MERIKINKERNEVIISFNERFYDKKAIDAAVQDFKGICSIKKMGDKIVLEAEENIDILGYEFYNYVLGLMKNI